MLIIRTSHLCLCNKCLTQNASRLPDMYWSELGAGTHFARNSTSIMWVTGKDCCGRHSLPNYIIVLAYFLHKFVLHAVSFPPSLLVSPDVWVVYRTFEPNSWLNEDDLAEFPMHCYSKCCCSSGSMLEDRSASSGDTFHFNPVSSQTKVARLMLSVDIAHDHEKH